MSLSEGWVAADWPPTLARAVTTTRTGGTSQGIHGSFNLAAHVGDEEHAVARNRRILGQRTGLERIQWLDQVHGTRCVRAGAVTAGTVPEADAAWTDERRLGLAVLTADCLPVAFAHRHGNAVAVAHAGWRGLVAGVLPGVVRALPGEPDHYLAWIGPGIGVDAYQVGPEVAAAVRAMSDAGADIEACLHAQRGPETGPEKYQLDLAALAARQLEHLGIGQVVCEPICTFADRRFYSYRREGATGRMATVVWLC